MLIACLTIGDTNVTLNMVSPLDPQNHKDDPNQGKTYTLSFHDLPTGEKEDLVFVSECATLYAFAAWIAADESELGALNANRDYLYGTLKSKKFLP